MRQKDVHLLRIIGGDMINPEDIEAYIQLLRVVFQAMPEIRKVALYFGDVLRSKKKRSKSKDSERF